MVAGRSNQRPAREGLPMLEPKSTRRPAVPPGWQPRLACLVLIVAVLSCMSGPARASQVRSVSLEEMTARATSIFSGRCVSRRVVRDADLDRSVTVLTFRVERAVKGRVGRTFTLRQIGGDDGTRGTLLPGLPRFAPG